MRALIADAVWQIHTLDRADAGAAMLAPGTGGLFQL
jgi:hypothetical protein